MPAPRRVPSLLRHAPTQRARVRLNGTDHYVGPWPDGADDPPPESRRAYDELISRWLAGGRQPLPTPEQRKRQQLAGTPSPAGADAPSGPTVAQVALAFLRHAEGYYRRPDGTPTGEAANCVYALRPLVHLFGRRPARRLRPRHLRAVRESMVRGYLHPEYGEQRPLSRGVINQRVSQIVRAFRWAAETELVPARVHLALATVRALQAGRSAARERPPVLPVALDHVEATLARLRPQAAGAVRLQLLTGMRPGEALRLCAEDLDRAGPVWVYRPARHKNAHKGRGRAVAVGPKAQAVLLDFIRIRCPLCGRQGRPPRLGSPDGALCGTCAARADDAGVCGPWQRREVETHRPLFSPRDEMQERHEDLRAARKSKVQPSQQSRKKARPKVAPGEKYSTTNFGNAVSRAACKAGVPEWNPNQLRHTHATEVRRLFGLEAAQAALGHAKADVTEIYAERDLALAVSVALRVG